MENKTNFNSAPESKTQEEAPVQKKKTRRRAQVQYPRPWEMWWDCHAMSLFSRQVKRGKRWGTAPPIEFGPDAGWNDVWPLAFELLGEGRHLNGRYLNGEYTDPGEPGSYIATMQNTRDESDGVWKNRLSNDAIARSGWDRGGSKLGLNVLEAMWNQSRSEIMREIWSNLDDDERARFPGLLVQVTVGMDTETEKWDVEPRAEAWALEAAGQAKPPQQQPIFEPVVSPSGTENDSDQEHDTDEEHVSVATEEHETDLEETLNMLLALRHGLMVLEVSLRQG